MDVKAVVISEQVGQILFVSTALRYELSGKILLLVVTQHQPNVAPILEELLLQQRYDAAAKNGSEQTKAPRAVFNAF